MLDRRADSIKTKHFGAIDGIDGMINRWLEENSNVIVLEIKFTSNATDGNWGTDALIIYENFKK